MPSTLSIGFIIAALAVLSCAFVPAERLGSAHHADPTATPAEEPVNRDMEGELRSTT